MSAATAKLKKQALQHEHDRQYDKALAIYSRLLDEPTGVGDEVDVALFNRAGDLALRVGDTARAVGYYERAVDLYAAGGLLNNAIALCNKVLRHAPDHVAAHYSLGVLHAKQGFRGDAKHHFVEYADRMHRAGRDDEALRALREFADLCSPGDDARAMLAGHLARTGKGGSASATLQAVFDAGAPAAAAPPSAPAAPPAATAGRDGGALVFLDLSGDPAPLADEPAEDAPAFVAPSFAAPTFVVPEEEEPVADLALDFDLPESPATGPLADLDVLAAPEPTPAWQPAGRVDGFEGTSWMDGGDGTIGLPSEVAVAAPAGRPALAYAAALPGELAMLEIPLAWEALPTTTQEFAAVVHDLEEGVAEVAAVELVGAAALDFLELDAAPEPAAELLELATEPEPALVPEVVVPEVVVPEVVVSEVVVPAAPPVAAAPAPAAESFVDLGDWLRETEAPRSTRMVTAEPSQTGDEDADFQRMLDAFKAGVERNIDDADHDSHYDLGVAFREMGLLEEAATQFQRASRAPGRPLRAIEALGQCLVDLGQPELALEALRRGIDDGAPAGGPLPDRQLVGVIYLLGVASEQTQRLEAACAYYRRVLATDLQFRDAARRLAQLSAPPR